MNRSGFPSTALSATRGITVRNCWWTLAGALALYAAASLLLKQDANWDLLNYHFYNAYAFLNGRLDYDIAPAQLQSFHNPALDIPFYWLVRANIDPRIISILLALPAGIAAFFAYLVIDRLFGARGSPTTRLYVWIALAVGVTGTAGVPLIGSTMNDWHGAMFVLIALWLVLKSCDATDLARRSSLLLLGGLFAGLGTGLKPTSAPYAVALAVALLVTVRPFRSRGVVDACLFSSAVVAGFAAAAGFWMWSMYERFGNPLYPYYNDLFKSPWWDEVRIQSSYAHHSFIDILSLPFRLFGVNRGLVGELPLRDWRVPFVFLTALTALCVAVIRKRQSLSSAASKFVRPNDARWSLIIVFWFISFALWAIQHSIYRYIIPLELLSGALIVGFLASSFRSRIVAIASAVAVVILVATTRYPEWTRVPFGEAFIDVDAPRIPVDSVVLIVEDAPLAFTIPFFESPIRFVGARNNFNDPWRDNLLAARTRRTIAEHRGPLYSLRFSVDPGDDVLREYGLKTRRDTCKPIRTNLATDAPLLCELERLPVTVR